MASLSASRTNAPQAFISSYAPRIRTYANALLTPVQPPPTQVTYVRTTKRGTTAINYAEDGFEEEDFEDSEGPNKRPTGLRSLRRDESGLEKPLQPRVLGKEIDQPVKVQGIWREWMGKPKKVITERQNQIQATLPLTLIPIRIDLDIPAFRPEAPLPTPNNARDFGIDETLPAYKQPDLTPAFRLKDAFLWNLHEALMTPDHFAKVFVDELDFPSDRKTSLIMQVTQQIRQQLEDYAGVALHPLFHSASNGNGPNGPPSALPKLLSTAPSVIPSPNPTPRPDAGTPRPSDATNGNTAAHPQKDAVHATASRLTSDEALTAFQNPDDTYRCIVSLNVNLQNKLYSDRFEWSLLHPPGLAEQFARQTCADLGLTGEWVSATAHAIYEAVLRLKKEVCENGGLLLGPFELDNEAALGSEAGWRYDAETLGEGWEPKVEVLSKEEIEKREGDRERQLRRVRRETARYSSTTNMATQAQLAEYAAANSFDADQALGRGERSKKKRRFRSLSPLNRDTPDAVSGYGGGQALNDQERQFWRCTHCNVWGSAVWAVRDGPNGPRSLCHNCGFLFERDKKLPPWSKELFANDINWGAIRR